MDETQTRQGGPRAARTDRTDCTAEMSERSVQSANRPVARFARPAERDDACEALARAGFVVVEIEGIGPSACGRLGEVIDEAIERELTASGAAGPPASDLIMTGNPSEPDRTLGNQLYRARSAGAAGIAVVLGPLRAAARSDGALDPRDCAALRLLAIAERERPVVLVLDSRDAQTGAYTEPVPLGRILDDAEKAYGAEKAPDPRPNTEPANAKAPPAATPAVRAEDPLEDRELSPVRGSTSPSVTATPCEDAEQWRRWMRTLAAARGPQPLGALEKLFTDHYVPLSAALSSGLDDPRARVVRDDFRNAFVRSYTDAFATFAATTKRPRMALDVHEMAARLARLHGARTTRLLLVDAMRWDVSRWVSGRLAAKLSSRAALTDELLLWSALPTKTSRQLETIARGVEALRAPAELEVDAEPTRGRTSEYVRRMRVGPRELHKLDLIEARLGAARGVVPSSLLEISEATAEVIARHAETLPPHTLLFVFGDHGFTIDRTGSAQQGGASPEEVLVGAFALLVGDVH